jgi:hypothetical protein
MKKYGKVLIVGVVIFMSAVTPAFSQNIISSDVLNAVVDNFAESIVKTLPFNSTIGLNWSHAHIGRFFPSLPPRLGVGASIGYTTMPITPIIDLCNVLNIAVPDEFAFGFRLPAYTVEARIGGIFLPFDVGVKYGYSRLYDTLENTTEMRDNYRLIGADLRYSILNSSSIPVRVSAGLGFNRLEGSFSQSLSLGQSYTFGSYVIRVTDPDLSLAWETTVLELKMQASLSLPFITPYFGVGLGWAWSKAGYHVYSDVLVNGYPITQQIAYMLRLLGVTGIDEYGFERMVEVNNSIMRLYTGISLNISFLKFDLTFLYNVMDNSIGGTLGARLQL